LSTLRGGRGSYGGGFVRVADGVHAWLQPDGSWGETNAGVITHGGTPVVVDTLWDEVQTRRFLAEVDADTLRSSTVVHTHGDGDHWWGNGALPPDLPILATEASAAEMAADADPGGLAKMSAVAERTAWLPGAAGRLSRYSKEMLAPFDHAHAHPRLPTRTYVGRHRVGAVELTDLGPAHTASDVIAHVRDAGVVFAGDLLFVGVTPVVWHGPVSGWIRALDALLATGAETFVPGHGPLCGPEGVRILRGYFSWVAEAGGKQLAHGASPLTAARRMFADRGFAPFRRWLCPERLVITLEMMRRDRLGLPPAPRTPAARVKLFTQCAALA
jgi:glyoxylase-like metal-dependent hydrolase (beta-lactamase superfamily II)